MLTHGTPPNSQGSVAEAAAPVGAWLDLWNGDASLADETVAEDFVAHMAPFTGTGLDTSQGLKNFKETLTGVRKWFPDLVFEIEVGPIVDGDHRSLRWRARGTYGGGFPGAAPDAVGREVNFTGTDTLRIEAGKVAEYWANTDGVLLFQQLGIREVPAG